MSYSWLPALLAEITEVAGLEAALALAEAKGGQKIYLPPYPKADHWFVKAVGAEAAAKICEHFRSFDGGDRPIGQELLVPLGPTGSVLEKAKKTLREGLAAGLPVGEASRRAGLHVRTGFYAKKRMKEGGLLKAAQTDFLDALDPPAVASKRR